MPIPERYLAALKEEQIKHAQGALNPSAGSRREFDYGKACGIAAGLELAERLFEQIITAQEEDADGSISRTQGRRASGSRR